MPRRNRRITYAVVLAAIAGLVALIGHSGMTLYQDSVDERLARSDLCAAGAVFSNEGHDWDLSVAAIPVAKNLRGNRMPPISETVGDETLAHFGRLGSVHSIDLHGQPVSDAGVVHLKRLRRLRSLNIQDTNITEAGAAELHEALPDCRIIR